MDDGKHNKPIFVVCWRMYKCVVEISINEYYVELQAQHPKITVLCIFVVKMWVTK